MIDFVRKNGNKVAASYSYLTSLEMEGNGKITLYFVSHTVVVEGRNLGGLYECLLTHTCGSVVEQDELRDDSPEEAQFVSKLDISREQR